MERIVKVSFLMLKVSHLFLKKRQGVYQLLLKILFLKIL